jgi:hypothetical protein
VGKANNLTGEIGQVRFTRLVKVIDSDDLDVLKAMTDAELTTHLNNVPQDELALYQQLTAEYNKQTQTQINAEYDLLEVNQVEVIDYIKQIVRGTKSPKTRAEYYKALRILRVSQITNGVYPQKRKTSKFGRTYYESLSIQSVKKELRYAILRGCYEYDAKSSVINWKYAFAKMLLIDEKSTKNVENVFFAIYYYLTYKKDYFDGLKAAVFTASSQWTSDKQDEKIKEAITALSFGAKLVDITWKNDFGIEKTSAISGILTDEQERKRFMKANEVVSFKDQQKRLDKFIVNLFWANDQSLNTIEKLKTKSGRRSDSRVLAWLYQHAETIMMDLVRDELDKLGVGVKANIHDAIVVDRKLSAQERAHIESVVRQQTNVNGFALGETLY